MKKIMLIMALVASLFAWENATITYVSDGDTLWLASDDNKSLKPFKARLIALDTFETKVNHRTFKQLETLKMIHPNNPQHKDRYQHTISKVLSLGFKAKKYVEDKYLYTQVRYYSYGKDKYGRELVWIDGLNFGLMRQGLAIYYPNNKISPERKEYLNELSKDANLNKRGIYKRF